MHVTILYDKHVVARGELLSTVFQMSWTFQTPLIYCRVQPGGRAFGCHSFVLCLHI